MTIGDNGWLGARHGWRFSKVQGNYHHRTGIGYSEVRAECEAGRSNTDRHAVLRLAFLDFRQTTIRSTLGISELQSRNTSPVQALRSSVVPRAKLAVGKDIAQSAIAAMAMRLPRLANELGWLLLTTVSALLVCVLSAGLPVSRASARNGSNGDLAVNHARSNQLCQKGLPASLLASARVSPTSDNARSSSVISSYREKARWRNSASNCFHFGKRRERMAVARRVIRLMAFAPFAPAMTHTH